MLSSRVYLTFNLSKFIWFFINFLKIYKFAKLWKHIHITFIILKSFLRIRNFILMMYVTVWCIIYRIGNTRKLYEQEKFLKAFNHCSHRFNDLPTLKWHYKLHIWFQLLFAHVSYLKHKLLFIVYTMLLC